MGRWVALCGLVLALGCSSDDGSSGPAPAHACYAFSEAACQQQIDQSAIAEGERAACETSELRTCSTEHYLRNWAPWPVPECLGSVPPIPIDANLEVSLWHGAGIRDDAIVEQTHALARYYEPHNLWFFADLPSQPAGLTYLMTGSEAQILAALKQAGIPTNQPLTPEQEAQANKIVGDIVFAPLRAFVSSRATPKSSRVNVVVVNRIVSPELEKSLGLPLEIAGLGISPALLTAVTEQDPQKDLYDLLGVPADFTPSLFVASGISRKYTTKPDNLIAHEMGHALGLVHTDWFGNLMTQGSPVDCRTALDPGQSDELTLPHLISPTPGHQLVFELRRRLLDRVLPNR